MFIKLLVVDVFVILDQLTPPLIEDSHLTILPVCPLNVKVPLLEPAQTDTAPATDPPTVTGLTIMVAVVEFAAGQVPLTTDALYKVVVVKLE